MRHPQYVGFVVIMLGFLLPWPTILTLLMVPVLVAMYVRLARREEVEALAAFGDQYARDVAVTPACFRGWAPPGGERRKVCAGQPVERPCRLHLT